MRDCQSLFDSFAKAFVGMAPCFDVTPEAYTKLVENAAMDLPPDSVISLLLNPQFATSI